MLAPLLGLAVSALGAFLLLRALRARRSARARAAWPTVPGEVLIASVEERDVRDSDGDTQTNYVFHLRYRYHVRGQAYEGTRIVYGPAVTETTSTRHRAWRERYVPGAAVTVYHHPEDAGDAVLEAAAGDEGSWASLAVGAGLLAFGFVVALG